MSPFFGMASAIAASGAALRSAANRAGPIFIAFSHSAALLVEPHGRQVLVEIMAWTDLPALHIRTVGNNTIIPEQEYLVGLIIKHMFLEVPHQGPLLREVGFTEHSVVQIDLLLVVEPAVAGDIDRGRQVSLHVE